MLEGTIMGKIYTPATIAEIVRRASDGAGARTIANDLGLKVTSLRVKCSQLGISLRKCRASRAAALEQAKAQMGDAPVNTSVAAVPRVSYNGHATHYANGANGSHNGSPYVNGAHRALAVNVVTQARPSPAITNPAIAAAAAANLSFKSDRTDIPLVVMVPRQTMLQLRQWGATKGMTAEGLAAELLNVIAAEGLYKAILDEDAA